MTRLTGAFLDTFRQRMLPRANMLATENSARKSIAFLAVATLIAFSGCAPSGPRALLDGDALLREGKSARAIEKLTEATKFMPDEPRAWNLLGLAYHRAGQPQLAAQAYRQALAKDRSNRVAVAHFNLGCLLLEQNNPAAAADELRSFTLTTNSAAGLVKLATAQLRLRQFDSAERNFNAALRIDLKNVEALNGVGVIHVHRNQRDAGQYFTSALQWDPKYAPALLNAAVLAQQNPAAKALAVRRFRDFLAVSPQGSQSDAVRSLVRQLEAESLPVVSARSNVVLNASLKTNALLAALQASNHLPGTAAPPRVPVIPANPRPQVTATAKTNAGPVAAAPAEPTTEMIVKTNIQPSIPNLPITVVTVTNQPSHVAVAADIVSATGSSNSTLVATSEAVQARGPVRSEETQRPGLLARLNPFRPKAKPVVTGDVPQSIVLNPQPSAAAAANTSAVFQRYRYLSPTSPLPGNRADAERVMARALRAQRAGNMSEASLDYQLATASDPAFFDARYNTAVFALSTGDLSLALEASEMALAIQPESINARYNFALALKQANYAIDAVNELQRILEAKPNEVRAHLTLGNLYAQQLNDPRRARTHYLRVLELEPRNPQAAAIRFWLAANP